MDFGELEAFTGPFKVIAEKAEGLYDKLVIAGKNGVFGLKVFTGTKTDFAASGWTNWIVICSKWKNSNYSNFGFVPDNAGTEVLSAQDSSYNQKAFKGNGNYVTLDSFFDNSGDVESMEAIDLANSLPNSRLEPTGTGALTVSHADWNDLNPEGLSGQCIGSLTLQNNPKQVLYEDSFDRFFISVGNGYMVKNRHPADFELVDASDTMGSLALEKDTSFEVKKIRECSAAQLKDFILERVRQMLGVTEDTGYTYTFKTELGNRFEENIQDIFARKILGANGVVESKVVDMDTVHLPMLDGAEIDIPYLQIPEKNKCKWKKDYAISRFTENTLRDIESTNLLGDVAELLKNDWYRTRRYPKFTTWAKCTNDADNYVIWDEENAILSYFHRDGSLDKQIAIGLTGYHTPASIEAGEPITCDFHKGIYLNLPELKDIYNDPTIGVRPSDEIDIMVNGELTPVNIYDLFTNPDYPLYYPDMRDDVNETEYLKYWDYCRSLDSFAPLTTDHVSFVAAGGDGGVNDYSYAAIEAWIDSQETLENVEDEQFVRDTLKKVKDFLKKNAINNRFLKGTPYYNMSQADVYKDITQLNDVYPMAFHSLIKDSNIVVTKTTVNVYGKLEFPSLSYVRNKVINGLSKVYGAQYPNRDTGDAYENGMSSDEVAWRENKMDELIATEADNVVDEIKRIYSSFYPGAINEDDASFAGEKSFILSVDLQTGTVTPQPLDSADISLDAIVSSEGNTLTAVTQNGLIEMGDANSNQLTTMISTYGNVPLIDAAVYDALKNSTFISNKVSLVTVGNRSKLSVEAQGEIQHMADVYNSTIVDINNDSIYLTNSILSELIENPSIDVTIMVNDLDHDNFQGLFYTNDMDPAWILSRINPDQTLFKVSGKEYADFATFENAASTAVIPSESNTLTRMAYPCVFQMKAPGGTLTAEEELSVGMYPQYKDIATDYRKYFYKEVEGQLQFLKNKYGNYIFRLVDMLEVNAGRIYRNPNEDPTKIENTIITAGVSQANTYDKLYPPYKDLVEGNSFKCQRIPALADTPNSAVENYPYSASEYDVTGEIIVKEDCLVLDVVGTSNLASEATNHTELNSSLLVNLVTDKYAAKVLAVADEILVPATRELLYEVYDKLNDRESYPTLTALRTYVNTLTALDSIDGLSTLRADIVSECNSYAGLKLLEDHTNIAEIDLRIVNKTKELPTLRPITDFIAGDSEGNMQILTDNDEMVIPESGYGQTMQGSYKTPTNCAFENGTFFDKEHFTVNNSGAHFKLVKAQEGGEFEVLEEDLPKLMYSSFQTADKALPRSLSTSELIHWQPVLLNLKNYSLQSDGSLMFNSIECTPNFNGNGDQQANYSLFESKMRTNCKLIYSESPVDFSVNGDVLKDTFQGEEYSIVKGLADIEKIGYVNGVEVYKAEELLDKIGYTRVYLKSDAIPNSIRYENLQHQFAYTNTPYRALEDKWAVTEEGKLLKIAADGTITSNPRVGTSEFINAIDVNSLLESFKNLQNVFSTFEVDKNGINSFYNLSKLLEISDKYLYSNYNKRVIELKEKGNQKTFLFKVNPKTTTNLLVYDTLEYLDRNRKDMFTTAINSDVLTLTFDAAYKTYNMAYLKDKDGDCVAKIFFKTPLNADYITTYSKL